MEKKISERRSAKGRRRRRLTALSPTPLSLTGVVRASSIFPILSAILLLLGGVCVAASRVYKSKRNVILGAGILFVAAGERLSEGMAGGAVHLRDNVCVCARALKATLSRALPGARSPLRLFPSSIATHWAR